MRLKVISSNSSGNCYLLEAKEATLIIECGVPFAEIKYALNYGLSSVVGCLVSHEHLDHCKAVNDVLNAGIDLWASSKTHEAMGTGKHYNSYSFNPEDGNFHFYKLGLFTVIPFGVKHDAKDPQGFYINHPESGNILFATDTYFLPKRFAELNNIIIEANYCEEILKRRAASGSGNAYVMDRVIASHMSLQQCVQTLEDNNIQAVNNIVLIHLSAGNSDARRFEETVHRATLKNVHVADRGMDIEFNKHPF